VKKAKQRLVNLSAQVAHAQANMTVENVAGLARDAAARPTAGRPTPQRETAPSVDGESTDLEDGASAEEDGGASDEATTLQNGVFPIYLVLAISVNLAEDYQKANRNVVDAD